jgi:hypothetical protein
MNLDRLISWMADNAQRIGGLVKGVAVERARWKPDPDAWSLLEVVNHLYDEEREDFRVRLDIILHHPDRPWPPIDPQGWVAERAYNQRALDASWRAFRDEREASLAWLRGLSSPDWDATYAAPFGPITAGDMLASWVAHDVLHMRQLVELHWAYTGQLVGSRRVDYAGAW